MSRFVLVVLVFVAMVHPSAQGALSKELQSLQGTWVITTVDGKPVPAAAPAMALVIEGNKYAQTVDGAVTERGEIRLDPSKTPMVMDLFIAEGKDAHKAQFGVVRVEGAAITMKLNAPAEPTRPKDFLVAAGYTVFVGTKKPVLAVTPALPEWTPPGLTLSSVRFVLAAMRETLTVSLPPRARAKGVFTDEDVLVLIS